MKTFSQETRAFLNRRACKVARARKGLTGKGLAALIDIPYQTWFTYESERRGCPQTILRRAARALGCSQKTLLR